MQSSDIIIRVSKGTDGNYLLHGVSALGNVNCSVPAVVSNILRLHGRMAEAPYLMIDKGYVSFGPKGGAVRLYAHSNTTWNIDYDTA